jgi:hypothetical protein
MSLVGVSIAQVDPEIIQEARKAEHERNQQYPIVIEQGYCT